MTEFTKKVLFSLVERVIFFVISTQIIDVSLHGITKILTLKIVKTFEKDFKLKVAFKLMQHDISAPHILNSEPIRKKERERKREEKRKIKKDFICLQ